ncbi:uncharacterized protein LOC135983433 [Chrysemys picta bellii]|uniref:uncharacterized protein LOC135983433 n=1 Tax=Chrysemys picta bellii TaxID=8478 RepID=UPI0032B14C61
MQADNRKRAPAWTVREVLDLIAIWGEDSVLAELRSKRRNAKTFEKISKGMMERGHNRDSDQCRVKVKELRQAYQKTKEANGHSGSEPRTCCFYDELHAVLGGAATTTPPRTVDSDAGMISSATPEDSADGEEEEEEDELAESTQHSVLPNSQDLFLSLTEVPSQPSNQDHDPMEGTSAAANSSSLPPLSRRLSQIRRRKKKTRDEMFAEIMESTRSDRAHLNEWKDTVSKYRKEASEREDRRDQCEDRRDQREERRDARDERWRQEDQRRQDATLGLREQTDMLRRLVELQEQQQDNRVPLQPLYNPPSLLPMFHSLLTQTCKNAGRGGSVHLPIPPQWTAQAKGCPFFNLFLVAFSFPPILLPNPTRVPSLFL